MTEETVFEKAIDDLYAKMQAMAISLIAECHARQGGPKQPRMFFVMAREAKPLTPEGALRRCKELTEDRDRPAQSMAAEPLAEEETVFRRAEEAVLEALSGLTRSLVGECRSPGPTTLAVAANLAAEAAEAAILKWRSKMPKFDA